MKKIVLSIVLAAFSITLFSSPAYAADFYTSSDYVVRYQLDDSTVHVTYAISEQNLSDTHRILSRSINYPSEVTNLAASANGSSLNVTSEFDGTYSKITVNFNRLLFSEGATLEWALQFDIPNGVISSGTLKYFFLTGFQSDEQTDSFKVYVDAPKRFGEVNFVSAKDYEAKAVTGGTRYIFTAENSGLDPATLIFGASQVFSFDYTYQVNPLASVEFVVPSDRYNQQVFFTHIDPIPSSSRKDDDGNYIVMYTPEALGGNASITFAGIAVVYSSNFTGGVMEQPDDFSPYLASDEYWEADNQNIMAKALELTSNMNSNSEKAEAIYQFVADHLVYSSQVDLSTHQRKGAAVALLSPEGSVCQEYTDLFVALARASDVPAREVAGYAEDVRKSDEDTLTLHSWPEYWDEANGWTQVDPTWASSSGGYYFGNIGSDHFSMLIRGKNSIDPSIIASFDASSTADSLDISAITTVPVPSFSGEIEVSQVGNLPVLKFSLSNSGNVVLTLKDIYALVGENEYTADADTTLIALPGTVTHGYISIANTNIPSALSDTAQVSAVITNSYYGDQSIQTAADFNSSWFYVAVAGGLFSILAIALLIVLAVKCRRHVNR